MGEKLDLHTDPETETETFFKGFNSNVSSQGVLLFIFLLLSSLERDDTRRDTHVH